MGQMGQIGQMTQLGFAGFLMLVGIPGFQACSGMMQKEAHTEGMEKGGMAKEEAMMKQKADTMAPLRRGMLAGAGDHQALGKVALTKDTDGRALLTLADFRVDRVPDGRVYLARNGDSRHGVELGKLTQFSGSVTFPIPAGVRAEDYDSVVIWCKKFNVEIGHAFFEKEGMEKGDAMKTMK